MIRLFAICLLLWPINASAQSRFNAEDAAILQMGLITTADAFILPAYAAQAEAAGRLETALTAYCGNEGLIDPVLVAFADTFLAWQRSSIVAIGPITDAEGPLRVQLWPDPKGFAGRAIRAAVAAEDPALLAPGGLTGRSIALTNLTTLEALIYASPPPGSYQCDLARAIAAYQANLAATLVTGWTPGSDFREAYDTAATGNAQFSTVDDLIRDFLAGGVVYVDRLRKFKLLRGLGEATGEARAERTEAVASGLGLASIETAFRTLSGIYDVPFGLFDMAPDVGGSMEYVVLAQSAQSVADAVAIQPSTLAEIAEADGAAAAELRRNADLTLYHEAFLKTGFASAIGLTAGFTAADGD